MSKIRKLSKNCSVKIELRIASYSKRLIIQNPSPKYKLWFKYSAIVKKKSLSTVIMQNIEKVLILFCQIYIQISEVAHWSLQLWKYYIGSVFLSKLHRLEQFPYITPPGMFLWGKTGKAVKLFRSILLFELWGAASKTSESFGIPDASLS